MSVITTVQSDNAPAAVGPYCQARWAGDLLFLSGQVGINPASGKLAGETAGEQFRQAMTNMGAVLEAGGLGWDKLVKATIFLTDMNDFGEVNQIYGEFLKDCPELPARACVQVAALPIGAKAEIEGVACK